jgi:hypothetical protein
MGVANFGAHPAHMSVESPKFGPDGSVAVYCPQWRSFVQLLPRTRSSARPCGADLSRAPDTGSLLPLTSPPPPRPGGASRGRGVSYVHCGTIRRGCVPTIRSRLRLSVARRGRVRGRGLGRSRSRSRGRVRGRGRRQPTAHPEQRSAFDHAERAGAIAWRLSSGAVPASRCRTARTGVGVKQRSSRCRPGSSVSSRSRPSLPRHSSVLRQAGAGLKS